MKRSSGLRSFKAPSHQWRMAAWVPVFLALAGGAVVADAAGSGPTPPGVMLKLGEWRGEVGTYLVPQPFENLPSAQWPMEGWTAMHLDEKAGTLTLKPMEAAQAKALFNPILAHRRVAEQHQEVNLDDQSTVTNEDDRYVRLPGTRMKAGVIPLYRFKNGTTSLVPELGYRFQLKMGDLPYAFTLQNGFRTVDGRPYGEGTQFALEMAGQRYEYDLGGYGWDVTIKALGDFDGDGRPDFLFLLNGSNSSHEALVLSSQASPGKNPPTTYLTAVGC